MPAPCVRVRFIKSTGLVASAIAFATNSLFDHVEFGTPEGTWIGAHAGRGVEERAADYCRPQREYYYEIPCSAEVERAALAWMRSKIGTRYNFTDIIGLLIHARSFHRAHEMICSQFVSDGLLRWFGPERYLNVLPGATYLITPETAHLSPLLVGHLVRRKG